MAQDTTSDSDSTIPIRAGISVSSRAQIEVPAHSVTDAEDGDVQDVMAEVAAWWDDLDRDERIAALNLEECDGRELVENLLFIDRLDGDDGPEVVIEY